MPFPPTSRVTGFTLRGRLARESGTYRSSAVARSIQIEMRARVRGGRPTRYGRHHTRTFRERRRAAAFTECAGMVPPVPCWPTSTYARTHLDLDRTSYCAGAVGAGFSREATS